MKIKNLLGYVVLVGIVVLFLATFLHVDTPDAKSAQEDSVSSQQTKITPLPDFKTVEINGREYRQARGNVGKYGGVFNDSTIGEGPKTFNPWSSMDATSSQMGALMFDGLVSTDAYTGKVIPLLAKSVEVDKSGTVYTVKLRKGLKWSDSQPITSADVVFTWNTIIAGGFGNTSARDNILIEGKMPEIRALDSLTVEFKTPKPFAPFYRQLGQSIAPKHILEPVTKQGLATFNSFWGVDTPPNKFVTSGMFRLQRYIPAQRVEFVRNPDYYMVDKKGQLLPYLDNYIFYIVGDINNQVLKFESGQLDMLALSGSNVARFKELEKRSDYKVYNLGPDTGTMFLTFNLNRRKNDDGKYYVNPIKQRWFNDENFRKAVSLAIDREAAVMNILRGVGAPLYTAESLSSIYLNEKLKNGEPKNLEKAKKLLQESGFTWNAKGRLTDKAGNLVEFTLITNAGNTERESLGVMVKEDLEKLGMKVNFKPIEFNVLVGKLSDSLDWEAVIIGLTGSSLEPHDGRNVWSSTGALHFFNQRKGKDLQTKADLRDWEAELDDLFEKGASVIEFEKRKPYYDRYQEIVYEQNPFIYLYSGLRVIAIRKKFGNINPTPLGGVLHNLEEVYVED
jgi:peptide/nickel transport system substrate-binding protein